ncbi:MAG: polysaccharide deacetylase family protein [Acidimicrobiales bacterium]
MAEHRRATPGAPERQVRHSVESLVLFDYEGKWGMPHRVPYDLEATTSRLLEVLQRHGTHAMFFVVGRIVEERGHIVERLHEAGQAIGIHGYRHERMHNLSPHALDTLGEELRRAREIVAQMTGELPRAFRAPYLLAPQFVDEDVTRVLLEAGFTRTSNRLLYWPEK